MENLLIKLAHLIHSRHKLIVFIFSILTAASLIAILRMEITTDIVDVLPSGNEVVVQFKDFMKKFSVVENITILVEFDKKSFDEQIDIIDTLSRKLGESQLIEHVDYNAFGSQGDLYIKYFPYFLDNKGLQKLRQRLTVSGIERQIKQNRLRLISPLSSPFDNEILSRDPLDISSIVRDSILRLHGNKTNISTGYYLTKDHKTAFIFAKPKGKSRDMAFVKKLKLELDSIIKATLKERDNPSGISISLTGTYIMAEEARRVIQHDIVSSFVLSVILIALLIWLVYRVRAMVLLSIGFVLLSSLSMTLAFAYFMFGGLNIVTSIVASVLIGLYVDYCILIINRFTKELKQNGNSLMAAEVTLTKVGPAIISSCLTTSLSFFSIVVTRFEGLYELGIASGIGVLLCLFSAFFLLIPLLIWLSSKTPDLAPQGQKISLGVNRLANLIYKKSRVILILSLIITAFLAIGAFRITFDNNPDNIGMKNSQPVSIAKKIADNMGRKSEPLIIVTHSKTKEEMAESFDSLEQLLSRWKSSGLIKNHDSLSVFLPPPSHQKNVIKKIEDIKTDEIDKILIKKLKKNGFVVDDYAAAYGKGIASALSRKNIIGFAELDSITDPKISRFYDKTSMTVASYIYPQGEKWDSKTLNSIKQDISGKQSHLLGKSILFDEIKSHIIFGSALAILITLILNLAVIYLHFRNIKHTVLVMLPVVLGQILTIGIMGYLNLPFNFINIGTVALIFGLGVDYGIYMMQAYLKDSGGNIENALSLTGRNIMMCAATTIAGCGSLITAKFSGIASIGAVLSVGAVICALVSLVMLPAILHKNSTKEVLS